MKKFKVLELESFFCAILLCNERYEDGTAMGTGDPYSANRYSTLELAQQQINEMGYPNASVIDFTE